MERLGYEVCNLIEEAREERKLSRTFRITSTDILKRLLPMGDTFEDLVFMFKEVARRLATEERTRR